MNAVATRKPTALNVQSNMSMFIDTVPKPNVQRYKYKFSAQLSKTIKVYYMGNNLYQIATNGLATSTPVSGAGAKIYNLYYTGPIRTSDLYSANITLRLYTIDIKGVTCVTIIACVLNV